MNALLDASSNDATVNCWSFSSSSSCHRLGLDVALSGDMLGTALMVIVVDLSRPWRVARCLERWSAELDSLAAAAAAQLPAANVTALKKAQHEYVQQRYAGAAGSGRDEGGDALSAAGLPELPGGMLEVNHGVPLVVVGFRSDGLGSASVAAQCRANAVQLHLRKFCLARGAALAFVPSGGDGGGEDGCGAAVAAAQLLQQYLLHRLYPLAFPFRADFDLDPLRPDALLFVASGQDSAALMGQLVLGDLKDLPLDEAVPRSLGANGGGGGDDDDSDDDPDGHAREGNGVVVGGGAGNGGECDDLEWLEGLKASLGTEAWLKRAVKAADPPGDAARGSAKRASPPLPPPPAASRRALAKGPANTNAEVSDFFTSLMNK